MGVDLCTYRGRIGRFGGGRLVGGDGTLAILSTLYCSMVLSGNTTLAVKVCLCYLLIIGNVEQNPGPNPATQGENSSNTTRRNLRSAKSDDDPVVSLKNDIQSLKDLMVTKLESIQHEVKSINSKFKQFEERLNNVEDDMSEIREDINTLRNSETQHTDSSGGDDSKREIRQLRTDLHRVSADYDGLVNRTKRCNLIFTGVPEEENETWQQTEYKITDIIKEKLDIARSIKFDRVHRIINGPAVKGAKLIVAMFSSYKDKEEVLGNAARLKGTDISIDQDYSKHVRWIRK